MVELGGGGDGDDGGGGGNGGDGGDGGGGGDGVYLRKVCQYLTLLEVYLYLGIGGMSRTHLSCSAVIKGVGGNECRIYTAAREETGS